MVSSKPGAVSLAPCLAEGRAGLGFGGQVSAQHVLVHDNGGGLVGHCCECVAVARSCCSRVCAAITARDAQERARCSVSNVQAAGGVEVQDYVWRAPPGSGSAVRPCQEEWMPRRSVPRQLRRLETLSAQGYFHSLGSSDACLPFPCWQRFNTCEDHQLGATPDRSSRSRLNLINMDA